MPKTTDYAKYHTVFFKETRPGKKKLMVFLSDTKTGSLRTLVRATRIAVHRADSGEFFAVVRD